MKAKTTPQSTDCIIHADWNPQRILSRVEVFRFQKIPETKVLIFRALWSDRVQGIAKATSNMLKEGNVSPNAVHEN